MKKNKNNKVSLKPVMGSSEENLHKNLHENPQENHQANWTPQNNPTHKTFQCYNKLF